MSKFKVIAGVVGLLVAVPAGCSLINATTSVATAPGRVIQKTMETDNIVFNYERFYDVSANYDARLGQVKETAAAIKLEQDPAEKQRMRVELSAQRASCRALASAYNADSQKINRSIFKSNGLPAELSLEDCNA